MFNTTKLTALITKDNLKALAAKAKGEFTVLGTTVTSLGTLVAITVLSEDADVLTPDGK